VIEAKTCSCSGRTWE